MSGLDAVPPTAGAGTDAMSPADFPDPSKRVGMSRISQSIAASLASRDRSLASSLTTNDSARQLDEDTVRVRQASTPRPPLAQGYAPGPASPAARPPAAPTRPTLSPSTFSALSGPQSAPKPWAQSPQPATPAWGQPEVRPVEAAMHVPAAHVPAAHVPVAPPAPAERALPPDSGGDGSDRPGRLRRLWDRSGSSPAVTTVGPTPPAAPEPPPTQLMPSVPDSQQSFSRSGALPVPTGHLGTVPRTAAPLPVPVADVPAPVHPPTPTPQAAPRTVRPTSIKPAATRDRQTRKARLRLARVDPWSVMKTALLFGVAGAIMMVVAVFIVFFVIEKTGLYEAVDNMVAAVFSTSDTPFHISTYINTQRAVGVAALIGALDVVILTALATIFAGLYNLAANIIGGVEITLAED